MNSTGSTTVLHLNLQASCIRTFEGFWPLLSAGTEEKLSSFAFGIAPRQPDSGFKNFCSRKGMAGLTPTRT